MKNTDNIVSEGSWIFSKEVTAVFDNMLERSIPNYETMRDLVTRLGFRYVKPQREIVDLGCSNGIAIEPFVERFGARNHYTLIDVSEPMLDECRKKYKGFIDAGIVKVKNLDITKEFPYVNACLVMSVLTLQFTPIEYRQQIIQNIYDALLPGGAFIYVEKVLGDYAETDDMLVEEYYAMKKRNGYTEEQISSKKKSLEGVLVPTKAKWNEEMLKNAGFKKVECFWRCLNFCGWIAIK